MPRLSIGLPVYNGEAFVGDAIRSLLDQTFTDFELIISDNCSTDRTVEIVQAFAEQDPRVRIHRNETNLGAARNFNLVFELATAEFFKWAAADDICQPAYLARCIDMLDSDPDIVLCHSLADQIDPDGQRVGEYRYPMRADAPDVLTRFTDLIIVRHDCHAVFGVIRHDALAKRPSSAPMSAPTGCCWENLLCWVN
ncbi:MAG: glycosyltransferase family 2 protein [bacterium]